MMENAPARNELAAAMDGFPHDLTLVQDAHGLPQIGFSYNDMAIHDVTQSECGRFAGTPEMYGLSQAQFDAFKQLGVVLNDAHQEAMHALCLPIQSALGVTAGDLAGQIFASGQPADSLREIAINYLLAEILEIKMDAADTAASSDA